MATAALTRYTPEEYLALERNAEFKSEYIDGRIIAMTGGSPEHADIVLNLGTALRAQLRPRGCRVFVNDVRARSIVRRGTFTRMQWRCAVRPFSRIPCRVRS